VAVKESVVSERNTLEVAADAAPPTKSFDIGVGFPRSVGSALTSPLATDLDKDAARLLPIVAPIPRIVEFPRKDSIGLFAFTTAPFALDGFNLAS
jgi:hypothetical protein